MNNLCNVDENMVEQYIAANILRITKYQQVSWKIKNASGIWIPIR